MGLSREEIDEIAEVAGRLRLTRGALGLSIGDLCRATSFKSDTYSVWEMGVWWPNVWSGKMLRNVLGYTLDWIYAGDRSGLPMKLNLAIAEYCERQKKLAGPEVENGPCTEVNVNVLQQAFARRTERGLLEEYDPRQAMKEVEHAAYSGGLMTDATHLEWNSPEEFARQLWVENPMALEWVQNREEHLRDPLTVHNVPDLIDVLGS